jgi:eukaryotic-like serine/threonine-protein kinase
MNETISLLQRFEVLSVLGSGAGGKVLEVTDKQNNGKRYALKLLTDTGVFGKTTEERFRLEFDILQFIRHPHVVEAYDIFHFNTGEIGYTMELVKAPDLWEVIMTRTLSYVEIDHLIFQLLDAVGALHQQGICHRDLKLENILYSPTKGVKLGDFGLIKTEIVQSLTQTGVLVGTAQYFPPEYIKRGTFNQQSDIYSLGILLYELISRKRWLADMDGREAINYLIKNNFHVSVDLPEGTPEKYRKIVQGCMQRDPKRRFRSTGEVKEFLLEYARNGGVSVKPRLLNRQVSRTEEHYDLLLAQGRRQTLLVFLTTLLVVVGALAGVWYSRQQQLKSQLNGKAASGTAESN